MAAGIRIFVHGGFRPMLLRLLPRVHMAPVLSSLMAPVLSSLMVRPVRSLTAPVRSTGLPLLPPHLPVPPTMSRPASARDSKPLRPRLRWPRIRPRQKATSRPKTQPATTSRSKPRQRRLAAPVALVALASRRPLPTYGKHIWKAWIVGSRLFGFERLGTGPEILSRSGYRGLGDQFGRLPSLGVCGTLAAVSCGYGSSACLAGNWASSRRRPALVLNTRLLKLSMAVAARPSSILFTRKSASTSI